MLKDRSKIWQKAKLGDIAEINLESIGENYQHDEIEYVDISSVGTGVLLGTTKYQLNVAPGRAKRLIKDGDTILSTVRPNRRSFLYIKNPLPNMVVSTGFAVLRASKDIDPRYLYYYVSNQPFTDYLSNHAKGSAYPAVDTETIERAEISLPSLPTQRRIASILSAYDDLIENNNRRIKILEEMAQAIYREWFVEFRAPGIKLRKATPEEKKVTGKDVFPEGWEIGKLEDIVGNIREQIDKENIDKYEFYVPIESIPRKTLNLTEARSVLDAQSSLIAFKRNDVLFGAMRSYFHKVVIAPFDGITRSTCFVLRPKEQDYYSFVVITLFQESTVDYSNKHSRGSTMPYAVWDKVLSEMMIIKPSENIAARFNEIVKPILQEISDHFYYQKNLMKTRDLLLPKLVNGEVEV